jgi:hypothetical protein
VGIIYLVIGIAGFIPGLVQGQDYSGIVYGVLAVMGLISAANLHTMFGLTPLFSHDVWLHAGTAVIAAYFGWGPVDEREVAGSRA